MQPSKILVCQAKGDSAASNHYWRRRDMNVLETIHEEAGPPVALPNGDTINDNQVGYLPIPALSKTAKKTRILKDLNSASLISIGQLADDGCTTHIDEDTLQVKKNGNIILRGTRNKRDNLYDIPIYKTVLHEENYVTPPLHGLNTISPHSHHFFNSTPLQPSVTTTKRAPPLSPFHIDSINAVTLQSTINRYKKSDKQSLFNLQQQMNNLA